MIQLNCTNCKALLQIDDAFAGGVCRCRYCGTIQTVPKHLRSENGNGNAMTQAAIEAKPAKTLFQKKGAVDPGGAGSGTGLDDLAGIVASSGLTSSRLQKKPDGSPAAAAANTPRPRQDQTRLIVIAASAVIVFLLGIIIVMSLRDKSGDQTSSSDNGSNGGVVASSGNPSNDNVSGANGGGTTTPPPVPAPAAVKGPNFIGEPITEPSIVYVLDRGDASRTENRLDLMKQALVNSVKSLGPERRFAVVFFYLEGSQPAAFPKDGLVQATPSNIADLQTFLDDVYGVGRTLMSSAVKHASQTGAEAAIFVPIKTFVDEGFPGAVMSNRGHLKVHCVTLAQAHLAPVMQKVARETGGSYRDVTIPELRAAAQ